DALVGRRRDAHLPADLPGAAPVHLRHQPPPDHDPGPAGPPSPQRAGEENELPVLDRDDFLSGHAEALATRDPGEAPTDRVNSRVFAAAVRYAARRAHD